MNNITITLTEREVASLWSAFALFEAEYECEERDEFNRQSFRDMETHKRIGTKIHRALRAEVED